MDAVNLSEMLETDVAEAPTVPDVAEAPTVPDVAEAPTVPDVAEAPTVPDVQVSDLQGGAGVDAHVGRFQSRRDCRV